MQKPRYRQWKTSVSAQKDTIGWALVQCIYRTSLVVQFLVEHVPPNLVDWVHSCLGHTTAFKTGTCDLSSLVLGIDGCVKENGSWLTTSAAFTVKAATNSHPSWPKISHESHLNKVKQCDIHKAHFIHTWYVESLSCRWSCRFFRRLCQNNSRPIKALDKAWTRQCPSPSAWMGIILSSPSWKCFNTPWKMQVPLLLKLLVLEVPWITSHAKNYK